jgi:hypothetical protein
MRYGLKCPGEKGVEIPKGHIATGKTVNLIKNWSDAFFVSPSVKYASDRINSDRNASPGNGEWWLLVEAAIELLKFTTHRSAFTEFILGIGEDPGVECRIEPPGLEEDVEIDRGSSSKKVAALAITLLKDAFIRNPPLETYQIRSLVQGDNYRDV